MNESFRAIVVGGTGQVGGAVVEALVAAPGCREVIRVTRSAAGSTDSTRRRDVVMDTGASDFAANVAALAKDILAGGDRVAGVSCVGVGSGSAKWSDEQLKALEVGVVGGFAKGLREAGVFQFCLLSAAGSNSKSRIKYARMMGLKEEAVQALGFQRLAMFRPGIIVGNAHTPFWAEWLGKVVPGPWGNVEQRDIALAFAAEIAVHGTKTGTVVYDNGGMRRLLKQPSVGRAALPG